MRLIPLSARKFAIVDDADYEWLSQWKWCFGGKGYAIRSVRNGNKRSSVLMHRVINKTPLGIKTDHRDGDSLNNQRHNLRDSNDIQNQGNAKIKSHKYKGVFKSGKNWIAQIRINKILKYLGTFESDFLAAIAYNKEAKKHFRDFAKLNIIGKNNADHL